jgi:hypothetical protein
LQFGAKLFVDLAHGFSLQKLHCGQEARSL